MASDPAYAVCSLNHYLSDCAGKIEWHHAVEYKGTQLNSKWAIISLCYRHHRNVNIKSVKMLIDWIVLNRATEGQLKEISAAFDYVRYRKELNKKMNKKT